MIKRLIVFIVARSVSSCLLTLACLTFMSGCVVLLPTPKITQHDDNIVVMETSNRVDLSSKWGMIKISREFYRHYEDAFDLLVFVYNAEDEVLDAWQPRHKGGIAVVRHAETGTGVNTLDIGRIFGSESRLKGVVHLASPKRIVDGSLLHEIMHLWVSLREVIPSVVQSHWGFSSVGGILGGFQADALVDLGQSTV